MPGANHVHSTPTDFFWRGYQAAEAALQTEPSPIAEIKRGLAYWKKGDKDQAIADFRKAIEIDPSNQYAKDTLKQLGVTP